MSASAGSRAAILRKDGSSTASYGPARGYTWPPFQSGNRVAVRHGAFSSAIVSEKAAEIRTQLIAMCPWLRDADALTIDSLCRSEARSRMLHDYVMTMAAEQGPEAVPPYLWAATSRAETNALRCTDRLGLNPLARSKLTSQFQSHM
jgi:hypothetical protein